MYELRPVYPNELYHHGIKNQQWGVQNGPPYPLDRATHRAVVKQERSDRRTAKREQRRLNYDSQRSAYTAHQMAKKSDKISARFQKKYGMTPKELADKNAARTQYNLTPGKQIRGLEKRMMRDTAKAADAYRSAKFWKEQSRKDFEKAREHARTQMQQHKDLKLKSYENEDKARSAYIKEKILANTLAAFGGVGLGVATGNPVLGGIAGSQAMRGNGSIDIFAAGREASNNFDRNYARNTYKYAIKLDKQLAAQERARKNYLY